MKQALTVLLVDDDPEQAHLLGRLLGQVEALDIDLIHHSSTRAAMADLLTEKGDVVLLDHHLGEGQTGLDLLRSMRDFGFDGPIVMLTGCEDPDLVESFLRFGADAYLGKGELDPEQILKVIRVALRMPHKDVPRVLTERNAGR